MPHREQTVSKPVHKAQLWWNDARVLWAKAIRQQNLMAEELARLAEDAEASPEIALEILGRSNGPAELLHVKLRALGLEAAEIYRISHALLAELEHTCAACPDKDRCAADMADDPLAPGWESYCPNSGTLKTLT